MLCVVGRLCGWWGWMDLLQDMDVKTDTDAVLGEGGGEGV
jgi:hypothetical protein